MQYLQELYTTLMGYVPEMLRPYATIALALFLIYSVLQVLKRNFIYLIALVVLLPASKPILKSALDVLTGFIKYLFSMAK